MMLIIIKRLAMEGLRVRISKDTKRQNHERIVTAAARLFRERGFDGVSVAELMRDAGLTHGGFYNHFESKDAIIAEATVKGFSEIAARHPGEGDVAIVERYVSRRHRDAPGQGCPAAALSSDAARQSNETKAVFAAGIEELLGALVQETARHHASGPDVRARAVSVLAQAVGAIVLSRACPDDSVLADDILAICLADCRVALKRSHPANA